MKKNSEEKIKRAYVWDLYSNGETKEEAEEIASQNINRFKKAEGDEIREAEGHSDSVPIEQLAEYISRKYLTSLKVFVAEAKSKRTLYDLETWWQKHQERARMNLTEKEFNELAIKVMPCLFNKKKEGGDAVTPELEPEEITLQLEFKLFCTSEQAKKIGEEVYALIGKNPMVQGGITLRKL